MERNISTPSTQLIGTHSNMKALFEGLPYTKTFAKGEIIYHQGDIAEQAYKAEAAPFLARFFQLPIHGNRTGLRGSANGEFHDHGRQT